MKLIKPKFEILEQAPGLEGMERLIELAGRTCYKSENHITEDSAKKFVDMMVKSGHGAMLEHGTVYIYFRFASPATDRNYMYFAHLMHKFQFNKYSKVNVVTPDHYMHHVYITTNYRVIIENHLEEALKFICEPTEYHEKRVTVRFTCDRGVTHEFVRHRVFSFAQESTRYCNYSKDKFGKEITCIIPPWLDIPEGKYDLLEDEDGFWVWGCNGKYIESQVYEAGFGYFFKCLRESEELYFKLIEEKKWTPQQARAILPNALKAELIMTGFVSDWEGFFKLRDDEAHAHPQAYELAHPLHEEFINKGYIK